MQISLNNLIPNFFDEQKVTGSQVWKQEVVFSRNYNVHIIAPSGSGKTSLIHFLYGLRNDYNGSIRYNDADIRQLDAEGFSGWRQQHVSIVFQDLRLFTKQTVYDNINIKRLLAPWHKEDRIGYMAERLGIGNKLDKPCSTCSYGEQQRIAIIRALQQPFGFLLLDEPFSHLDENNRKKAMELMQEEATARNASIILADLRQIDYFKADKTLYL